MCTYTLLPNRADFCTLSFIILSKEQKWEPSRIAAASSRNSIVIITIAITDYVNRIIFKCAKEAIGYDRKLRSGVNTGLNLC